MDDAAALIILMEEYCRTLTEDGQYEKADHCMAMLSAVKAEHSRLMKEKTDAKV